MYADLLMGINFLFNFYLLWLTSLVGRTGKHLARTALGAFLGAVFSLTLIHPGLPPALINALFPCLMILAAFYPFSPQKGVKLLGAFYFIALLSCGTLLASQFILGQGDYLPGSGVFLIPSPSPVPLVLSLVLVSGLVRLTWLGLSNMRTWQGRVTVRKGGREKTFQALVDTGNSLREPVSGSPVIIIYYRELLPLLEGFTLPGEERAGTLMALTRGLGSLGGTGFCIVPYRSLGREGSFLPGFRPEEVVVSVGETSRTWKGRQVVICLAPDRVSQDCPSLALVHPELIQ